MNSRQSYLDTLNTGRQRRSYSSMEQLNRSLETLEQRIGRAPERPADHQAGARRDPLPQIDTGRWDSSARRGDPSFDTGGERTASHRRDEPSSRTLARDIERLRGQEDSVAAVGKIAGELKGLREEVRQQMTTGLKREFDALRGDIERAYSAHAGAVGGPELTAELERLSRTVQSLSQNTDDKNLKLLRLEIEQVRSALDSLAREDTVRSVDQRWDELDRRFSRFEDRFAAEQRPRADDPAIAALSQRLEQISQAVNGLPESLSLRSLEEKVRTLAGAIDHFARQQDGHRAAPFEVIEERLDEISRAIVASATASAAPHFDPEPMERVEARISSLARQIEELVEDRPSVELVNRFNSLAQRVDEIAAAGRLPDQAIERLAHQIGVIAEKLDQAPAGIDPEPILRGIEQRFETLSQLLDRRQDDAIEHGQAMFRDLEQRLDSVAQRLDQAPAAPVVDDIIHGIEQRFDMLSEQLDRKQGAALEHGQAMLRELEQRMQLIADRLDERNAEPQLDGAGIMNVIDSRFEQLAHRLESREAGAASDGALSHLEARLQDISARLEHSSAQVASVDPDIIRSLEAQVAELSQQLARPAAPVRSEFDDIAPRLDDIERSLADTRNAIIEAARLAAENAVRNFAGPGSDVALFHGLADDLKSLEDLSRRSDERNTKTFEAIHDTLLKIVDRLAYFEDSRAEPTPVPQPVRPIALRDAPSIEPTGTMPLGGDVSADAARADARQPTAATAPAAAPATPERPSVTLSTAEAAVAAADALDADTPDAEPASRVRSMLSGLARAFQRKDQAEPEKTEPSLPGMATAESAPMDLEQPLDPQVVNRPLAPGSGAPDLNAIMRRVRDERGSQPRSGPTPAGSSDFVAAARRNAQAAAAEAQTSKRAPDPAVQGGSSKLGGLFGNKRKIVLMGATAMLVALAGLQLGKAFFRSEASVADSRAAPAPAVEGTASVASADAGSVPAAEGGATRTVDAPDSMAAMSPVTPILTESDSATPAETAAMASSAPDTTATVVSPAPQATAVQPKPSPAADTADGAPSATATETAPARVASVSPAEAASPAATDAAAQPKGANADPRPAAVKAEPVPADAGPLPLREAAEAGDPKALFEIGSRYAEGRGTKADLKAAAKWYEKSADLGLAPAQYRIGNFYEKGIGVDRDVTKAKTWYQMAAQQGNAAAMHNLAVLFAVGVDGPADNDSAALWFEKAAELGVKDSQFNLGILSAKGVGVPRNLEESYKWFALVAKTGDRDAAAKRDEIANAMRPEQLQRARAAVELWKAKPVDPETNAAPQVPDAWRESGGTTASVDKTNSIDMKKAIRNIQIILAKNGYDAGSADGVMGQKTKDAIVAFQAANGLDATGEINEPLVKKLLEKK
jgi:localization factor PodJL